MPFGAKPSCSSCKGTTTNLWRKTQEGQTICNKCVSEQDSGNGSNGNGNGNKDHEVAPRTSRQGGPGAVGSHFIGAIRKSARLKPSRHKPLFTTKAFATKGKSRRVIFKKNVIRSATSVATTASTDFIFHEDQYYQVGDVVSILDVDGGVFYAQLRGFLQDQYSHKSAVITWLLPTTCSPREGFDPSTYILGPEEDLPRDMKYFEFVCHAPSEYFKSQKSPYPTLSSKPELGYIWTSLGYEIAPIPTRDELYGLKEDKKEDSSSLREKTRSQGRTKVKEEKDVDKEK